MIFDCLLVIFSMESRALLFVIAFWVFIGLLAVGVPLLIVLIIIAKIKERNKKSRPKG